MAIAILLIAAPSLASAACTGPAGVKGEFFYNDDFAVLQFCNGTDWIGMYGGSGGGGSGVTDGDKGDISVSGSGASWMLDDDVLDFTELKDALSLDASTDIAISGSQVLSLTNTGTGNSLVINDQASDTSPFVVDQAGHVGIGVAAPTQSLDVSGKVIANSMIVRVMTGLPAPAVGSGSSANFTGLIAAFAASSCPTGWTEYTAARGRFLRGIDPSGSTTVDPSGTRAPANTQADAFQGSGQDVRYVGSAAQPKMSLNGGGSQYRHIFDATGVNGEFMGTVNNFYDIGYGTPRVAVETRPKNVAVLFCQYTGSGGGGGGGGSTTLAALTDVDLAGNGSGKVLSYNGTKWVPTTASSGASSSGAAGYLQVSGGSGAFTSDSTSGGQLFWDSTNHRLGIGTTSPADGLHIESGTLRISAAAPQAKFAETDNSNNYFNVVVDGGIFGVRYNNAWPGPLQITAAGNVGIGTGSPGSKLDVAGTVTATQYSGLAAANNFQRIVATVTSMSGGSTTASCPAGYTIIFWGMIFDQRTQSGTGGWLNGTTGCDQSGNGIVVNLSNYGPGSAFTNVTCQGLCARN